MKSNKVLSIVGLVITFAACFAIGYFVIGTPISNSKAEKEAARIAEQRALDKAKREKDSLAAVAAAAKAAAEQAALKSTNTPVIEPCQPRKVQSFGYNLNVTASVPSGDPLHYALCEVGKTEEKYKSDNGYLGSRQHPIAPSETGSYDLIVTNTKTGDSATLTVSGFNKVSKISASQLQTYLNMDSYPKDFYAYLVEAAKQQILFENLPAGISGLTNVDALGPTRIAYGWTFEVIAGSLKYDRYNRVESFKVRIKE